MSNYQHRTIQDLLNATYGGGFGFEDLAKADAPVLTTTTGFFNAVYGAAAFNQLNHEANAFAIFPKYPWQKSGFRVITADAGSTASGGIAQNGTIPETIKPTVAEINLTVKEVSHSFDVSFRQSGLAKRGDDAIGEMEWLRNYFSSLHAKRINEQLLVDYDTLAGNNFESIDRVTASTAETTALSYTTGDEDIYDIDRSANSWADAVVNHNSGTDRNFALSLIEDTLATLENNGARTNLILTGSDTKWEIIGAAQTYVRYQGLVKTDVSVRVGLNGVSTEEGMGYGVRVAEVYGIPLFVSQAVPKDTISRIYLLDTTIQEGTGIPRLGISLLYPTMYFESGMDTANPNPFAVNRFGTEGVFYTAGELVCTFFKAQGKIRDLQGA